MTDYERLLALLESFGLEPDVRQAGAVALEAKKGGASGYAGFVCQFEFDSAGKYRAVFIGE